MLSKDTYTRVLNEYQKEQDEDFCEVHFFHVFMFC